MANPLITTTFGAADPNAAPLTVNDLLTLLNQVVSTTLIGTYTPYIISSSQPSVDDQDKAWIQLDNIGRPISIKTFYSGNWRRVYNGMLGEVRMFAGDPTNTSFWDMNGHGVVGEIYDGWQIMNGLNGAPDWSNRFILGSDMADPGHSLGWNTGGPFANIVGPDGTVRPYNNGGQFTESLLNDNLPLLSNNKPADPPGLWIYGQEAKESVDHPGQVFPLVDSHFANALPQQVNLTQGLNATGSYGKNPPLPIWTTPSFIASGFIIFQGY